MAIDPKKNNTPTQSPDREFKNFFNATSTAASAASPSGIKPGIKDRRVRLSPKPGAVNAILGQDVPGNILQPLFQTSGLMFPYTPIIQESTSVNYEMYELVHSNQPIASFKNVGAKDLQVSGAFTAQNDVESRYCLAVIHYLRTVTKMYFGIGGTQRPAGGLFASAADKRGTPPPILLLNGYGTAMFHNLPVIVTSVNIEYPQDIDYVEVTSTRSEQSVLVTGRSVNPDNANSLTGPDMVTQLVNDTDYSAWIPTKFNIAMTLSVQNTPSRLRQFNLDDFRTGNLIKKGGWI